MSCQAFFHCLNLEKLGEEAWIASPEPRTTRIVVDEALRKSAKDYAHKAEGIALRSFGELSARETAAVLGISEESVMRDWRLARSWLKKELGRESSSGPGALATD